MESWGSPLLLKEKWPDVYSGSQGRTWSGPSLPLQPYFTFLSHNKEWIIKSDYSLLRNTCGINEGKKKMEGKKEGKKKEKGFLLIQLRLGDSLLQWREHSLSLGSITSNSVLLPKVLLF